MINVNIKINGGAVEIVGDTQESTDKERKVLAVILAGLQLSMEVVGAKTEVPLSYFDREGKQIPVTAGASNDGPVAVNQPVEA